MKFKTDIAIIGGGPGGLAAAVEASSKGHKVDIFEKSSESGGIMKGGQGPFAADSFVQKQFGHILSCEEAFNYLMEFAHWKTDARLVSKYVNMSAETIQWFADMGINFSGVSAYYDGAQYTEHNFNHMAIKLTTLLLEKAKANGAELHCSMSAKHLILEDGRIVGFTGITSDGDEFKVEAQAVVLATGGFGGNDELARELGYHKGQDLFYTFDMPNTVGDGLRMAWEVGAGHSPMMMDVYCGLASPHGGPGGTSSTMRVFREPNLMVNLKGERFVREDLFSNPAFIGNAIHRQYKGCGLMIVDEDIMEDFLSNSAGDPAALIPEDDPMFAIMGRGDTRKTLQELSDSNNGNFFVADSIQDLAEKSGINSAVLEATIAEYNKLCEAGFDSVFFKNPANLKPIKTPKLYAAKFFCDTYGGLGGIAINDKAQVIDGDFDPIAGLFACGNDANSIFGGTYPFYLCGNTSGFAYNTGRLAAQAASEYIGY